MGKIHRTNRWVPLELNDRQMENRKNTCEILLPWYKKKSFLHNIVTGEEKWIYFENLKSRKSWVDPGPPSTSTARLNALTERQYSVFGGTRGMWITICKKINFWGNI